MASSGCECSAVVASSTPSKAFAAYAKLKIRQLSNTGIIMRTPVFVLAVRMTHYRQGWPVWLQDVRYLPAKMPDECCVSGSRGLSTVNSVTMFPYLL